MAPTLPILAFLLLLEEAEEKPLSTRPSLLLRRVHMGPCGFLFTAPKALHAQQSMSWVVGVQQGLLAQNSPKVSSCLATQIFLSPG